MHLLGPRGFAPAMARLWQREAVQPKLIPTLPLGQPHKARSSTTLRRFVRLVCSEILPLISCLEYLNPRLPTGSLQCAVESGQRCPVPDRHIQVASVVGRKAVFPGDRKNIVDTFCD